MQLKLFILPVKNLPAPEAEMNGFLRSHRPSASPPPGQFKTGAPPAPEAPVSHRLGHPGPGDGKLAVAAGTGRSPVGINALWGDGHVSFSPTKQAFDPSL